MGYEYYCDGSLEGLCDQLCEAFWYGYRNVDTDWATRVLESEKVKNCVDTHYKEVFDNYRARLEEYESAPDWALAYWNDEDYVSAKDLADTYSIREIEDDSDITIGYAMIEECGGIEKVVGRKVLAQDFFDYEQFGFCAGPNWGAHVHKSPKTNKCWLFVDPKHLPNVKAIY